MDDEPGPRVGVVVAGGYSARFGVREKALHPVDDTPMIRRVVDQLALVTEAVVVNCRVDQRPSFARVLAGSDAPVAFAIDPVDGAGPLAGFAAALAVHDAPLTLLGSVDQPFVDPADWRALCRAREGMEAVAPRPGEELQPTPAVLPTGVARTVSRSALSAGKRSLHALFDRMAVRNPSADRTGIDPGRLRDVDVPAELLGQR